MLAVDEKLDEVNAGYISGCTCANCSRAWTKLHPAVEAEEQVDDGKLRMTAEVYGYKYMIEGHNDLTLDELFGRVVVPLVIAMGYSSEGIAKLFVDGDPTGWDSAYGL